MSRRRGPIDMSAEPTEMTAVLARMALALADTPMRQLAAVIEMSLGMPEPEVEREETFVGLISMITPLGLLPSADEYDAAAGAAAAEGHAWPSRKSLTNAYGNWGHVLNAAVRYLARPDGGRLPRSYAHGTNRPPPGTYTKEIAALAIIECQRSLGAWPTVGEYSAWAALRRAAARSTGNDYPLLPVRKQLRRLFGSWDNAVGHAQTRERERARHG
jgi:hypothetical protein